MLYKFKFYLIAIMLMLFPNCLQSQNHLVDDASSQLYLNDDQLSKVGISREAFFASLDDFLLNIYEPSISVNHGGMKACDMFTLFLALKMVKPTVVIESGVWRGISTKVIRKIVGQNCKIICLDPIEPNAYRDKNCNTLYYTGNNFIDFNDLDVSEMANETVLVFFDDHIDAVKRLFQAKNKMIKHLFFNDNYPVNAGGHFTLEHLKNRHFRLSNQKHLTFDDLGVVSYILYPNIFPGLINTMEGSFLCESFIKHTLEKTKYNIFLRYRETYRWNTYVKLQ